MNATGKAIDLAQCEWTFKKKYNIHVRLAYICPPMFYSTCVVHVIPVLVSGERSNPLLEKRHRIKYIESVVDCSSSMALITRAWSSPKPALIRMHLQRHVPSSRQGAHSWKRFRCNFEQLRQPRRNGAGAYNQTKAFHGRD